MPILPAAVIHPPPPLVHRHGPRLPHPPCVPVSLGWRNNRLLMALPAANAILRHRKPDRPQARLAVNPLVKHVVLLRIQIPHDTPRRRAHRVETTVLVATLKDRPALLPPEPIRRRRETHHVLLSPHVKAVVIHAHILGTRSNHLRCRNEQLVKLTRRTDVKQSPGMVVPLNPREVPPILRHRKSRTRPQTLHTRASPHSIPRNNARRHLHRLKVPTRVKAPVHTAGLTTHRTRAQQLHVGHAQMRRIMRPPIPVGLHNPSHVPRLSLAPRPLNVIHSTRPVEPILRYGQSNRSRRRKHGIHVVTRRRLAAIPHVPPGLVVP
mmetsp:Transcript_3473/g.10128  ORF Transcript_3473/g.10128 Transcript_3473/m.10128 type:complete len:322 (-) Transcript_3473:292-1257(-)